MRINISDILKTDGASLKLNFDEKLDELESVVDGFEFDGPVEFSGELVNIARILKLTGRLRVKYETSCFMCLKTIEGEVDILVKEDIVNADNTEDTEAYTYQGYYFSLDRVLIDNIVLDLPMKLACSNECKGICQMCGADLNSGTCNCKEETINPKFEALKNYFNNQE